MSNPNSQGDPDTYQGINWEFGDFDNGGVHINSGVMNYWYYLLVEGGSGTNDDGYSYNVPSIGRGDAEQIAYRNLTVYLTASSGYIDARVGSELAAIDLFGENSAEHLAVIEAWNAVGVPTADPVLSVVDNHDFGDTPVGLKVKKEITVTNLGNALLAVSSITSTNPQFEVSQSTLQIPESSSAKFAISFTPSELGNTSGEITLLSNGGDATISIVGNGVEPPVISVSPSSLNEALFTGEIGIQNITIDNSTGGSNLQWEVGLDYITNSGLVKGSSYQRDVIKSSRIKSSPYEQPIKDFTSQKPTNIQAKSASGIGGKLYALDHINQLILELDPETGAILNSFDSPENIYGGPDGLAYDGSHLYFTNDFGSGNIHKIDATDGSLVATANFSNLAIDGLAHSGEFLYASDYSSFLVYKLDFDTEEVIETIDLGQYIGGGFTFAGRRNSYFVTNFGDVIYEVDAETNSILNSLIPNGTIYGLGYSNALEVLFVSNVSSGTVQALNPDDGTILYELSIGGFAGIASDEGMFHSWLKLAQNGGNLAPGESLELEVTFDATGLFGGEYSANLIIESNDPINTEVTVPVALDVTGAPDISVSSNSLDFGSQFMGAIITDTVIVSNVGTDDLIISSIEIDNTKFEYELSSDVIAPFDKALLIVTYSPDAAIEDNGSITINNNDSDESIITISLAGEGVEPPVMLLSPDTIHDDVLVGETVLQSITVDNSTGGSDLVWEMTITSDTINDLAFEKEAYADWTLAENQDCITENVCLTRGDSQGLFNAVIETSYSSTSPSGTEWARGTSDDPTSSYSTWRNTIESCPPCHLNQPLSLHLIEEDLYFDVVFTSWDEGGSGGGFSYVRSSPTPGWITSEKYQGTVPAGQLDVLQVSLDATNLLGGEYATNLLFYSNDPLNPEDTIVALLSVTGVPDISMSASTIDFGQQFVGAIITDTVIVSNDGTDDLIISSIEIDNTKFEYELSSDVIAPSDEALLIVTYSPDVVSEDNGSITINSNDSDESI
ncbi:MAG: choice-of-anchor D domain-containing protein, partial [Ekhidna sp.]